MKVLPQVSYSYQKFNFKSNFTSATSNLSKIGSLNHETYLFREPKTDEFVQNYIRERCFQNPELSIVSGACSSGEEIMSYLIMLDDIADKLHFSAFDIDEKVIQQAKTGKISIAHDCQESYLFGGHFLYKFKQKSLQQFRKYFTRTGVMKLPEFYSYLTNMQVSNPIYYNREYTKHADVEFKLDDKMLKKIDFKTGDVLNLEPLYDKNSIDVLLFRNAMYHILCEYNADDYRVEHPNSKQIANLVASKMYSVLKKDGLVVFGEKEYKQGIKLSTIKNAMLENGFTPIDIGDSGSIIIRGYLDNNFDVKRYYHIWQK